MKKLAVTLLVGVTAACGSSAPPTVSTAANADKVTPSISVGRPGPWPDAEPGAASSCISLYPDRLGSNANAFDATVTAVHVGPRNENAGGAPATVDLDVHEVFAGPQRRTVTMKTWDFMLPKDAQQIVGLRVLLAAGVTLDLKGCGYSRPYDSAVAVTWRQAF